MSLTRTAVCLAPAAALDLDLPPGASTLPFPYLFFLTQPVASPGLDLLRLHF